MKRLFVLEYSYQIPPPYNCTPTSRYPDLSFLEIGLTYMQSQYKTVCIQKENVCEQLYYLQTRWIGMRTDNRETVTGIVLAADLKSNDSRAVSRKIVFTSTLNHTFIPTVAFLNFGITCCFQDLSCFMSGMERWRGLVDKLNKVLRYWETKLMYVILLDTLPSRPK